MTRRNNRSIAPNPLPVRGAGGSLFVFIDAVFIDKILLLRYYIQEDWEAHKPPIPSNTNKGEHAMRMIAFLTAFAVMAVSWNATAGIKKVAVHPEVDEGHYHQPSADHLDGQVIGQFIGSTSSGPRLTDSQPRGGFPDLVPFRNGTSLHGWQVRSVSPQFHPPRGGRRALPPRTAASPDGAKYRASHRVYATLRRLPRLLTLRNGTSLHGYRVFARIFFSHGVRLFAVDLPPEVSGGVTTRTPSPFPRGRGFTVYVH